jgi:hypothetical protein
MFGEPPVTALGQAEATFYSSAAAA